MVAFNDLDLDASSSSASSLKTGLVVRGSSGELVIDRSLVRRVKRKYGADGLSGRS
jgi:hypothetical protein